MSTSKHHEAGASRPAEGAAGQEPPDALSSPQETRRSKLDALRREVAEIEARRPLNRAEALAVIIRQAGGVACGCGCGEPLDPLTEGVRDEHVIALGLTGTNDLRNRSWWRLSCSKAKDKRDVKAIAKAKRIEARTNGTRRERKPIPQHVDGLQGRGFDRRLTKGFDGKVRPRTQRREP